MCASSNTCQCTYICSRKVLRAFIGALLSLSRQQCWMRFANIHSYGELREFVNTHRLQHAQTQTQKFPSFCFLLYLVHIMKRNSCGGSFFCMFVGNCETLLLLVKKNRTIVTLVDFVLCLVLCKACIGNGDLSFWDCCVGSRDIIWREKRDERKADTKPCIMIVLARSCINIPLVRRIVSVLLFGSACEWRIVRR